MLVGREAAPSLISYRLSLSFRAHGHSGVIEDLLAPSHCVFLIVTWNSFLCMSTVSLVSFLALGPHMLLGVFSCMHTLCLYLCLPHCPSRPVLTADVVSD